MARTKSTSGSKTKGTNATQEQPIASIPADMVDVKVEAAEPARVETKPEVKIALEPRKKFEVVKTESRRLVPINLEEEIRRRAYELYQQRGATSGHEADDWLAAEREVRQRYHQQQHSA